MYECICVCGMRREGKEEGRTNYGLKCKSKMAFVHEQVLTTDKETVIAIGN